MLVINIFKNKSGRGISSAGQLIIRMSGCGGTKRQSAKSGVERYLSPVSGSRATMVLP